MQNKTGPPPKKKKKKEKLRAKAQGKKETIDKINNFILYHA